MGKSRIDRDRVVKMYEQTTNRYPHYRLDDIPIGPFATKNERIFAEQRLKEIELDMIKELQNSLSDLRSTGLQVPQYVIKDLQEKFSGGFIWLMKSAILPLFSTQTLNTLIVSILNFLENPSEYYELSSRLCHWGMQRLGYDKFREITIQGLFGDGVFMEYVRQTGSHNIVMTEEVMEQLSSERMADNITLQQVFNYMGETPVILIVDGYTSVIIDYTVKHRINILRCVRPDDFERGVPHKFGIKKGEGFTYVIEDDEFNNPLLTHFSKACLWTPDTSDSTKEGDEFFSKMLRVFINSTLMLKCTNLEADTESILIRKDKGTNNKKKMKKNRRAVRMEDHMFSFIDMNTVRFRDTGRKKEEKEQDIEEHEGRKSPRPHMRVGHFRTQWYKNEAGNKFSQIIFIRATAVRGGGSDDRYIFNVVR